MTTTPTLEPIAYQQERMMDRGIFTLFHRWDLGDDFAIEYWRGIDSNGACLRALYRGHMVKITHYATPGAAINVLRIGNCPIPGVPPMTEDERRAAEANAKRQLRAGLVTTA